MPDKQIIEAIEKSMVRAWIPFANLPAAQTFMHDGLLVLDTGLPDVLLNAILLTQTSIGQVDINIEHIMLHFAGRGLPFSWYVSPLSQPEDVARYLISHGMVAEEESIGMALDFSTAPHFYPAPMGFTTKLIENPSDLADWIAVMKCSYPLSNVFAEAMLHILLPEVLARTRSEYHFLGLLNNQPVATATLSMFQDTASIYDVTTMPHFRGFGIGTAITDLALKKANEVAASKVVLQSSQMGFSVYRRLGFREYCRITRFSLAKS